jgi:hypothetical protein
MPKRFFAGVAIPRDARIGFIELRSAVSVADRLLALQTGEPSISKPYFFDRRVGLSLARVQSSARGRVY